MTNLLTPISELKKLVLFCDVRFNFEMITDKVNITGKRAKTKLPPQRYMLSYKYILTFLFCELMQ